MYLVHVIGRIGEQFSYRASYLVVQEVEHPSVGVDGRVPVGDGDEAVCLGDAVPVAQTRRL